MANRESDEALVVRVIDEFWNEQALDRIGEVFAEDAVIHFGATDYVGHAGIIDDFARPFMSAFPDLKHEILALVVDGDMAAMRYRGTGHMQTDYAGVRGTGQPFEYHGIGLFRLADGRVAEVWSNSDMANWLAAQPRAGNGRLFAVTRTRGGAWDPARAMDEQAEWDPHAAFMDELAADGFVALGGPLESTPDVLLIIRAQDETEVRERLAQDPWHDMDLLRVKSVVPWNVLLGGLGAG